MSITTFYQRVMFHQLPEETNADFAKRLGVTADTLKAWSQGRRPSQAGQYIKLADRLGCSPAWLHFGKEAQAPERLGSLDR